MNLCHRWVARKGIKMLTTVIKLFIASLVMKRPIDPLNNLGVVLNFFNSHKLIYYSSYYTYSGYGQLGLVGLVSGMAEPVL